MSTPEHIPMQFASNRDVHWVTAFCHDCGMWLPDGEWVDGCIEQEHEVHLNKEEPEP